MLCSTACRCALSVLSVSRFLSRVFCFAFSFLARAERVNKTAATSPLHLLLAAGSLSSFSVCDQLLLLLYVVPDGACESKVKFLCSPNPTALCCVVAAKLHPRQKYRFHPGRRTSPAECTVLSRYQNTSIAFDPRPVHHVRFFFLENQNGTAQVRERPGEPKG